MVSLMCPFSLLLNDCKAADVVAVEVIGNVGVDEAFESVF